MLARKTGSWPVIADSVGFAGVGYAAQATEILKEAAIWSAGFGSPVWSPAEFDLEGQLSTAEAGELIGGFDEIGMAACMHLQKRDTLFWPDDPDGEALYVHKVAVARRAAGKGWLRRLISFATDQARDGGAQFVRLDATPHPWIRRLYVDFGFRIVDTEPRRFGERMMIRLEQRIADACPALITRRHP